MVGTLEAQRVGGGGDFQPQPAIPRMVEGVALVNGLIGGSVDRWEAQWSHPRPIFGRQILTDF
jgi:hypothetical protein